MGKIKAYGITANAGNYSLAWETQGKAITTDEAKLREVMAYLVSREDRKLAQFMKDYGVKINDDHWSYYMSDNYVSYSIHEVTLRVCDDAIAVLLDDFNYA